MQSSNALQASFKISESNSKSKSSKLPFALWLRRHKTRNELKALQQDDPERLLRDLGLHPDSVERECKKWFWQA